MDEIYQGLLPNFYVFTFTFTFKPFRGDGTTRLDVLAASDPSMTRVAQGGRGHGVSGDRAVQRDHAALSYRLHWGVWEWRQKFIRTLYSISGSQMTYLQHQYAHHNHQGPLCSVYTRHKPQKTVIRAPESA